MPRASWEFIGDLPALIPVASEQHTIATFLDRETARIDTLIEKKQRQIELLKEKRAALISHAVTKGLDPNVKMKDSGIEWLGDVPEHWEKWRLSHACTHVLDGTHFSPESFPDGDRLYITAKNIKEWGIELSNVSYIREADHRLIYQRCAVKQGDVLYIKDGATAGIATVNTLDQEFSLLSSVALLRPQKSVLASGYLVYLLNMGALKKFVLNDVVGGAMTRFTLEIIGRFQLVLPPLDEQRLILELLDRESARIEPLILKVEASIDKLREYRTALISAAVTGKIDVRKDVAR
jgi:type I restriction enzyme, S subunit